MNDADPASSKPPAFATPLPRKQPHWLIRLAKLGVFAYLVWCTALYFAQPSLIFPRHIPAQSVLPSVPTDAIEILAPIPGGTPAVAWLLLPPNERQSAPSGIRHPLAVWLHGNAEVIDELPSVPQVEHLRNLGLAVLLVEYRGYGRAGLEGQSPTQDGIVSDALTLIAAASARPDIDADRIVYVGRSLGGGVACAIAAQRPPAAMILITTFTSVASFAHAYLVPEFLVRFPFRNDRVLQTLDRPVLVLHGDADTIIPVAHGRALAKLLKRGRYIEESGSGHLDFPRDLTAYCGAVEAFLAQNRLLPGR